MAPVNSASCAISSRCHTYGPRSTPAHTYFLAHLAGTMEDLKVQLQLLEPALKMLSDPAQPW